VFAHSFVYSVEMQDSYRNTDLIRYMDTAHLPFANKQGQVHCALDVLHGGSVEFTTSNTHPIGGAKKPEDLAAEQHAKMSESIDPEMESLLEMEREWKDADEEKKQKDLEDSAKDEAAAKRYTQEEIDAMNEDLAPEDELSVYERESPAKYGSETELDD